MKNNKLWITLFIIAIVLSILFRVLYPIIFANNTYQWDNYNHDMMWGYRDMGYWMIIPILLILFLIFAGYKIYETSKNKDEDALSILKQRYASGEITEDEYNHKKKVLIDKK